MGKFSAGAVEDLGFLFERGDFGNRRERLNVK